MDNEFKLEYLKSFAHENYKEIQEELIKKYNVDESYKKWSEPFDNYASHCKHWNVEYNEIEYFITSFIWSGVNMISNVYYLNGDREIDVFHKALKSRFIN
jgi:hypothetical protein